MSGLFGNKKNDDIQRQLREAEERRQRDLARQRELDEQRRRNDMGSKTIAPPFTGPGKPFK